MTMVAAAMGAVLALAVAQSSGTEVPYAAMAAPAPGASICPGGLCGAEALNPLFEALAATEAGRRDHTVHILQIGDSHTAGDRITGALRARLQARFGAGGRGVLPPGVPYQGYAPMQVQVTVENWPMRTEVLSAGTLPIGVGLTGSEADVQNGAVMRITAEPSAAFDQVQVCGEAWLASGELTLAGRSATQTMRFDGPVDEVWRPVCHTAVFDGLQTQLEVRPRGRLKLYDVRLTRRGAGVEVSNLGVVGATTQDLALRNSSIARIELASWKPDLIIIAFGVNDGFTPDLEPQIFEGWLRTTLIVVHALDTPVLILGAPDGLKAGLAGSCGERNPPAALAMVRDVQKRVAAEARAAFWDWHGRMGGDCSAEHLATLAEPFVRPDRVHFTSIGADWIGGVLSDDLLAAYDRWKAAGGKAN